MLVVDPKNRPDSSAVLARVSYILQSGGSTPSMSRVLSADSPSQPDQNAQQAVPPPNPKPQEQWVANFDSPSVAAALFPQEHQSAQSPVPITSQTTSDHHADGEQNSLPQTGRYRLKPPEPLPLWNSAGESVPSSSAHDALQEPDAAQTGSAGGQVRVQQGHEPIVVAPSSAHLPRGGSDAGSGASTPGAITPRLVQPPRLPVEEAEGVEVVRRQLAEALAANAALQRRVAQLESMVRSQAATISALHSQNQQAVALGPHKKGSSVGCYEFGSSKRVSHATAGFEAAVRQETMVGGEGGFDPSDPFPP